VKGDQLQNAAKGDWRKKPLRKGRKARTFTRKAVKGCERNDAAIARKSSAFRNKEKRCESGGKAPKTVHELRIDAMVFTRS
jgi:hypothetical protein